MHNSESTLEGETKKLSWLNLPDFKKLKILQIRDENTIFGDKDILSLTKVLSQNNRLRELSLDIK